MNGARRAALACLLASAGCASVPSAPPADDRAVASLIDRFAAAAAEKGSPFPLKPRLCDWPVSAMISWRESDGCLAVSRWEEISPAGRALLTRWGGGRARGERLFDWLFRWFLVPRELARVLQGRSPAVRSPSSAERAADDAAAAFLMGEPGGPARLEELAVLLKEIEPRLGPPAVDDPDRLFDQSYEDLKEDPALFGAYEIRFIADSLRRRGRLVLGEALKK